MSVSSEFAKFATATGKSINGRAKVDLSNVTDQTILTRLDALGFEPGGGVSAAAFVVDIHDYGAKGDAKAFKNCTLSQTTVPYDTIGTSRYTFTTADIGKKLWLADQAGGGYRTITAISAGKAVISLAAPSWYAGQPFVFGTDDTAAMEAALAAAQDKIASMGELTGGTTSDDTWFIQGAVVALRSGHAYAFHNPEGSTKRGAVVLPRRVGVRGNGAVVYFPPVNIGHGFCNVSAATFSDFLELSDMKIFHFGGIQRPDVSLDTINIHAPSDGYQWVEAFQRLRDLFIFEPARDGIFMRGRGETILRDINVINAQRFGIHFNHLDDYVCLRVNSGGAFKTGIRVESSPAGKWFVCKSYYSGANGDTVANSGDGFVDADGKGRPTESQEANCANWHFLSDNDYNGRSVVVGCESQESRGSGVVIEAPNLMIRGFQVADPARSTIGAPTGRPSVLTGIHIKGRFAHGNSIDAQCLPNLTEGIAANWGAATSVVYIEGLNGSNQGPQNNRGNIEALMPFVKGQDGTTHTGMNLNGGSLVQGAGTSNGKNTGLKVNQVAVCT